MKVQLLGVGAAVLVAGGVAGGMALNHHTTAPQPVIVQPVAVIATPTASPTATTSAAAVKPQVLAPHAATVDPVTTTSDSSPAPAPVAPTTQEAPVTTPAPDPTPTDIQVFPVTTDSAGRAGNAPPPPPAPTGGKVIKPSDVLPAPSPTHS
jgi:hypothetical protein